MQPELLDALADEVALTIQAALAPLQERLQALEALPAPRDGKDGAPGAPGQTGEVGPRGEPGERGLDGATGAAGRDGAPGERGAQGEPGTVDPRVTEALELRLTGVETALAARPADDLEPDAIAAAVTDLLRKELDDLAPSTKRRVVRDASGAVKFAIEDVA